MTILEDKIKGVLFGQAIGDALGLGTEFMTKEDIVKHYPQGLTEYSQIIQDYHRSRWQQGDWTDDTDMMLCIAGAIIRDKKVDTTTIAQNFKNWFNGTPMGIGRHTHMVLFFNDYVKQPQKTAETIWKLTGRKSAANGGIMRTSIIGVCKENAEGYAADVCRLTHTDPRCVGSCVIVSLVIQSLLYKNYQPTPQELINIGERYDSNIKEHIELAVQSDGIKDLTLEEDMGYTLKALSAALWSLYHCHNFEEGLLAVVNAGGDADTNAAVACSLLGVKYGYSSIPSKYVDGLMQKEKLNQIVNKLIEVIT